MRQRSWQLVASLGMPQNSSLPELHPLKIRSIEQIANRTLALSCVVAHSFGFDSRLANEWLVREGIVSELTEIERRVLLGDYPDRSSLHQQVDSLFALLWVLGMASEFSCVAEVPDDLVHRLPDIKRSESSVSFKLSIQPIAETIVASRLDEAFCLHWAARQLLLNGQESPLSEEVIRNRRYSLEWVTSECGWDEVSIDT